jgi:hypothetical protein
MRYPINLNLIKIINPCVPWLVDGFKKEKSYLRTYPDYLPTLVPVLLGSGRSLFGSLKQDIELQHLATRTIDGGFVQIKYRISTLKK